MPGPLDRFPALADADQGAGDIAHHIVQKPVCADVEPEPRAGALEAQAPDGSLRAFRLTAGRSEGTEIMPPKQRFGGLLHIFEGKSCVLPGDPPVKIGRAHLTVQYHIAVTALQRAESGVERVVHRLRPQQRNIIRQVGVDAANPGTPVAFGAGVKMNDLADAVHAGVGSTGSDNPDRLIGHPADGFFHALLDRGGVVLVLPAGVVDSAVFNAGSDSGFLGQCGLGHCGLILCGAYLYQDSDPVFLNRVTRNAGFAGAVGNTLQFRHGRSVTAL